MILIIFSITYSRKTSNTNLKHFNFGKFLNNEDKRLETDRMRATQDRSFELSGQLETKSIK